MRFFVILFKNENGENFNSIIELKIWYSLCFPLVNKSLAL